MDKQKTDEIDIGEYRKIKSEIIEKYGNNCLGPNQGSILIDNLLIANIETVNGILNKFHVRIPESSCRY